MNNEEKILEILAQMQQDISSTKQDISGMKQDISGTKQDISGMKQDISGTKQDISGMKQDISGMKQDISGMKQDISGINVRLDTEFTQKFNLLAEGQQAILNRIDRLEEITEDTKASVDVIYAATVKHGRDIEKLKRQVG